MVRYRLHNRDAACRRDAFNESHTMRPLLAAALPVILGLAACTTAPVDETALIADPYEGANRSVHAFNKGVDTALLRPASQAWSAVPEPVERLAENFVGNLALPSDMLNNALQGDGDGFGNNFGRFVMNSTLGLGGFF